MLIKVKVFPNSKKEEVIKKGEDSLEIKVKEKPINNQANFALFKLLSKYFQVPVSSVRLVRGARRKNKIFEINL